MTSYNNALTQRARIAGSAGARILGGAEAYAPHPCAQDRQDPARLRQELQAVLGLSHRLRAQGRRECEAVICNRAQKTAASCGGLIQGGNLWKKNLRMICVVVEAEENLKTVV